MESQRERLEWMAKREKSPLAIALLNDEASRIDSQNRSAAYLERKRREQDRTPIWIGYALCLVLGFFIKEYSLIIWDLIDSIRKAL